MKCLLRFVYSVGIAVLASHYLAAGTMQFGSPGNHFSIDFELIQSPNNTPDNTGSPNPSGSVSYKYQMGTFEVSRFLIIKYNVMYGHANDLEITMENMGTLGGNGANQPATGISWNEAARFANWLNEITGNAAAYKFNGNRMSDDIALWTPSDTLDYNPLNPYRSMRTLFALPTANEWYKAAYFNPTVTGGGYWDYTQGSNTAPTSVSSSVAPGTAVYDQPLRGGPSKVDEAGGLSSNGMMGMGGNVWEWQETAFDSINDDPIKNRGYRGGSWIDPLSTLSKQTLLGAAPNYEANNLGFRIMNLDPPNETVPEPSSFAYVSSVMVFLIIRKFMRRSPSKLGNHQAVAS